MKTSLLTSTVLGLAIAATPFLLPARCVGAPAVTDDIEALRGVLKADRKVVIAEVMQLTDAESAAFWPVYREYRTEMDVLGDGILKLVLEYADVYPQVPEDRADKMLKDYLALEKDLVKVRAKHMKKVARVLPKSKVMRFAQLENRLDLALRLQLAGAVPLVPVPESKP